MKGRRLLRGLVVCGVLLGSLLVRAQVAATPTTDILGVHDLGAGSSPVRGANANACIYCHAPHNGLSSQPLWNQRLSTQQYNLYPSATESAGTPTTVGKSSQLCLSCHDGTVAVGTTLGIGNLQMIGSLQPNGSMTDSLGSKLEGSHPFSMQPGIKDAPHLASSLFASHTTKDADVSLIDNNIECSTCHDVHNQFKDKRSPRFLVRDNTKSDLCFACHDVGARTVNGSDNSLAAWPDSAHKLSDVAIAPKAGLGGYTKVSEFGCSSCHASHGGLGAGLLRKNPNRPANVDDTSQTCLTCHDGNDSVAVPLLNIAAAFKNPGYVSHPFSDSNNAHAVNEPTVLDRNRHTTCADCHASHAAQPTAVFSVSANVRPSQVGVPGVTAEGAAVKMATNQYEICLRCHGTSDKKQSLPAYGYMPERRQFPGDVLDVSLEFAHGATSSHPVMRDATAAELANPSLLKYVYNVDFKQGRAMSNRLLCTDCHNHDNNREFGGIAPNGAHGSKNEHMLERQYIMSKVADAAAAGTTIVNLNVPVVLDPVPAAPYALCAKCHDLNHITNASSWPEHQRHITDGFSCSVCHSSHGTPAGTTGVTGRALVSFDLRVVGRNNNQPVTYNGTSCTLQCHDHPHQITQ